MSEEIEDLYKALDQAIGGFEARIIAAALKTVEREKAVAEKKMQEFAAELRDQLSALQRQVEEILKSSPNAPQPELLLGNVLQPARPSDVPSFPPLPKPLTVRALAAYVRDQGFEVGNNRPDGGLWVFHDQMAFGALAEHLERGGVQINYLPNGRRRRAGPQYHLDALKKLQP